MFNSRNLGAMVVKEDPHVKTWDDARYGIQEMYIEESYGFGIWPNWKSTASAPSGCGSAGAIVPDTGTSAGAGSGSYAG